MCYKLKYSSLLSLKKKNSILYIKGPLGYNILKIPSTIIFLVDYKKQIIYFYSKKIKSKKEIYLYSFLSIFLNTCRSLVFGELISLNLNGLGLKFLDITNLKKNNDRVGFLIMNLGYSDLVYYFLNYNHSIFFLKDNRNIICFSSDYSFLCNQISTLFNLKKPDRYKKKGFTLINKIL